MRLIIATKNKGKLKEIRHILCGIKIPIVSLSGLDKKFIIKENGKTFLENAVKKTAPVSRIYKDDLVVGEDSGLEVDYLGGKPGVYSKRYSGKNATDLKNNRKLLTELRGLKAKERRASFCCCLALMKNGKLVKTIETRLVGRINEEMKGNRGFGYDPLFFLPKYKKTVAQIALSRKNKISHRAKAFNRLKTYLRKYLTTG